MYNIFLNPSITAILFGIAVIFLFAQLQSLKNKIFYCVVLFFLMGCIAFTIYYNSRAVWFGIATVVTIMIKSKRKIQFTSLQKKCLVGCFLLLVICAFLYKQNSTSGRLFIYKINALMLQEYWFTGINQPYSVVFNHTQANYFFNNPTATVQQKLLASNNYFVLNEWFHIFIHYSIFLFVTTIIATLFLLKICFIQLRQSPKKHWAVGIVLFLLIVSLVSYPFSFGLYVFIFWGCVFYIVKHSSLIPIQIKQPFFYTLLIGLIIGCTYNTYKTVLAEQKKKEVTNLFRVGYINQALKKALAVQHTQPPTQQVYEQIAAIYLQKNNIDSAIYYINLAHNFICNDELHNFWGNSLLLQNKPHQAIDQFTLAVNIIPHKFKNRIDLLKTYLLLKNVELAKKCAQEIIELPEKVPSKKSAAYKQEARLILDSLSN